jgi:transcriptional antiterminator
MLRDFDLNTMNVKDIIKVMMIGTEYDTFKDLAQTLNVPPSTLQYSLNKNSLRFRDFQEIAELLGYEIKVLKKEKANTEQDIR